MSAAASATRLVFDGDRDYDLDQRAVTVAVGQVPPSGWSVRVAVGAVIDGRLAGEGRTADLGPGPLAAATVARPWTWGRWFVDGSASLAASRAPTRDGATGATAGLWAIDGRVGVAAGRRLGPVSPYLLARAFGGPVLWAVAGEDVVGTDAYHVQVGIGASAALGAGWSAMVDVSALGERAASVGVAYQR